MAVCSKRYLPGRARAEVIAVPGVGAAVDPDGHLGSQHLPRAVDLFWMGRYGGERLENMAD